MLVELSWVVVDNEFAAIISSLKISHSLIYPISDKVTVSSSHVKSSPWRDDFGRLSVSTGDPN